MRLASSRVAFRASLLLSATVLVLAQAGPVAALTLKLPPVAVAYPNPVYVTHAGDGSSRLYVVEQAGMIQIPLASGGRRTFLDIRSRVLFGGERGLLGLAFHPHYEISSAWGYRKFYVYYTRNSTTASARGDIVVQEFRRSTTDAYKADPSPTRTVLAIDHSRYSNHNGGAMNFGPDGYLYIATGDGGGSGDPLENAQNKDRLLGKLLRISPLPSGGRQYTMPSTNPFYGDAVAGSGAVWSYGLRNPWRFSFDRTTGDLWIGDVGQNRYEEIDFAADPSDPAIGPGRGVNWGWDCYEGNATYELSGCPSRSTMRFPVGVYSHTSGSEFRCSITGGYVYRGPEAGLQGRYLFADYCSGEIFSWTQASGIQLLRNTSLNITSFGEDLAGNVYITATNGYVYRLDT